MAYSETFLDLINRIQEETVILGDEVLDKMLAIFPGHSYYVKGSSGTGKSELIMKIITAMILPKRWGDVELPGNGYNVVLFDTDLNFNVKRQLELIIDRIQGSMDEDNASSESLLKDIMNRMWVLKCKDALELKTSLTSLNRRIKSLDNQQELSKSRWLFVVDSIDAFYWAERNESLSVKNLEMVDAFASKTFKDSFPESIIIYSSSQDYRSPLLSQENTIQLHQGLFQYKHHEVRFNITEKGLVFCP